MSYLHDSSATLRWSGPVSSVFRKGALANDMIVEDSGTNLGLETYNDPMETMLTSLREIAFRTSLQAGKDNATATDAQQSISFAGLEFRAVYVTNRVYMLLAATVNVVSLVAVAATFHGWWELGRKFSLNPLEIAKAFDSPLLAEVGSNLSSRRMDRARLAVRVRYGEALKVGHTCENVQVEGRGEPMLSLRTNAERPQDGRRYGV
jgi:hypothetical protein